MSDRELLDAYLVQSSEAAFSELVARHIDLVYSIARRHLADAHAAQDVAQAVFVELARHARDIRPTVPLVAWLHVVSRRKAIDAVRRETTRKRNELSAASDAMTREQPDWSEIAPLLDEAVESLSPADRTAVLLRYFSNKSLREVGAEIGTSEDLAQKRVSRASERLRGFLTRRGVVATSAGLATHLSAHALEMAPASLAASVATSALSIPAAALPSAGVFAMATIQKIAVGVALVAGAGVALFQASAIQTGKREHAQLQQEVGVARADLDRLAATHRQTVADLTATEQAIDTRLSQLKTALDESDPLALQARTLQSRHNALRARLERQPALGIPEFSLLKDEDWWKVATELTSGSETELRRGLAKLRTTAQMQAVSSVADAFKRYATANDGNLPSSMKDLAPYIRPPGTPQILNRYELLQTGSFSDPARGDKPVAVSTPVDPEFDTVCGVGATMISYQTAVSYAMRDAQTRFARANGGKRATSAQHLMPYLKWPLPEAAVDKALSPSR